MTRRGFVCLSSGLLCVVACREAATGLSEYQYSAQIVGPTVDYWWSGVMYPHPLTVRVVRGAPSDSSTVGVPDVPVRFSLAAGHGEFTDTVVVTDANGFATPGAWIVGGVGTNAVDVSIPSGSRADSLGLRFTTKVFSAASVVEYRLTAEGVGIPQPLPDAAITGGRIWLASDGMFVQETEFSRIPLGWLQAAADALGTYAQTDSLVRFVTNAAIGTFLPAPNGILVRDTLFVTRHDCCEDSDVLVAQVFVKRGPIASARRP